MGTRRGGGNSGIARFPRKGTGYVRQLKKELGHNPKARIAVNAAVGYAAASNPSVASVVAAYKVGKFCYNVGHAYKKTYERTHDSDRALDSAERAAVQEVQGELRSRTIEAAVNAVVPLGNDQASARFGKELVKSTAEECLEEVYKRERRRRRAA